MEVGLILEDLFNLTDFAAHGTSYRHFQVKHEKSLDLIDRLLSIGLIKRENDEYFISISGLAELDTVEVTGVFDQIEQIYSMLRERYFADPGGVVLLKDVALATDISLPVIGARIELMTQCSQWAGGWTTPHSGQDFALAHVVPGDGIVRFPTFRLCMDQNLRARTQQGTKMVVSEIFGMPAYADQANWTPKNLRPQYSPNAVLLAAIPADQGRLLTEIHAGKEHGLMTITSMGLRGLIDMVCVDKVGDVGNFRVKVDALLDKGHIGAGQRATLLKVIDVGSASSHRGFTPIPEDVDLVLQIVTQLLEAIYVHPKAVDELAKRVPKRV